MFILENTILVAASLADSASQQVQAKDQISNGTLTVYAAVFTAVVTGFWAWVQNRGKSKNDQFASFMAESEKFRKELREELEKQEKKSQDELTKLKAIVKDQEVLIKVLEEKQYFTSKYGNIIDFLPQIVWTATPDGNVNYYNSRAYQYTGHPMEVGKNFGWTIALHPEDVELGLDKWQNCLLTGNPYYYAYRLKRNDGAYRWNLGVAFPKRNDNGEIIQWVGTCTDIHDYRTEIINKIKAKHPELLNFSEKELDK